MGRYKGFNNAVGIILSAGPNKKVKIIHGLIDFGNNISRPASKGAAIFGWAIPHFVVTSTT